MRHIARLACALALTAASFGCGGADRTNARVPRAIDSETPSHAPTAGDAAPAFSLRAIDGAPLTLKRGQVTLLVFWATWSEPDKRELIQLQGLQTRFGASTLSVLALSIDDEPSGLAEFARTYGLKFPIAWDEGHRVSTMLRVSLDPTTYVIDRSGIIRFVHGGYHDGEAEQIASEIESLLR